MPQNLTKMPKVHQTKIDADALNRRLRRITLHEQYVICVEDNDGSELAKTHAPTSYTN
jgi:hypothetical protein